MTFNSIEQTGNRNTHNQYSAPTSVIILFDDNNERAASAFADQLKQSNNHVTCIPSESARETPHVLCEGVIISLLSEIEAILHFSLIINENDLAIHIAIADQIHAHTLINAVLDNTLYKFLLLPDASLTLNTHLLEARQEIKLKQQRNALLEDIAKFSDQLESLDSRLKTSAPNIANGLSTNSQIDPLTNLPNRYLILDRIKQAINVAQRNNHKVAILSIDIDRFALINQSQGLRFGNQLLREFSQRLVNCTRQTDSVAREGNDEFLLVMADIDNSESALQLIKRFQKSLSTPFIINQTEVFIAVSIGVCIYPTDAQDPETLARCASTAMKHTKKLGGNSYHFFEQEMNSRIRKIVDMESNLFRALEKNEFLMYYQPQVDIPSGDIVGAEALLRWQRPGIGIVPPNEFIPILEETGLIQSVGEWILNEVSSQNQRWLAQGLPSLRMSVNLSLRQVQDDSILSTVANLVTQLNASKYPQTIELEITESIMMKDAKKSISLLVELNKMGFNLAIDDFGTGYASLNYLTQFPVHSLKIDLSFVQRIGTTEKDAAIVKAIIVMAHSLGLRVTAEGVETQQQLDFLTSCGCNEYQGYLFSKPLPAMDFEALVRERNRLIHK